MKNERAKKAYKVFYAAATVITLLFTAASVYMFLFRYDFNLHYYTRGTLPALFKLAFAGAVLLIIILPLILLRRAQADKLPSGGTLETVFSAYSGFAFLGSAVILFMNLLRGEAAMMPENIAGSLTIAFTLLTGFFFIFNIFAAKADRLMCWLSLGPVVWGIVYVMAMYFTKKLPINCEPQIIRMMAILAFLLYMLQEIRFRIEKQSVGAYAGFGFAAVMLGLSASLPYICKYFTDKTFISSDVIYSFCMLGASLYVFSKLTGLLKSEFTYKEKKEKENGKKKEETAEEEEAEEKAETAE